MTWILWLRCWTLPRHLIPIWVSLLFIQLRIASQCVCVCVCVCGGGGGRRNENPRARSLLEFICFFTETSGCYKLKVSNHNGYESVRRNCDDGSEIGSFGLRRGLLTQIHIHSFILSLPIVVLSRKISELPYGTPKDAATIKTPTPCLALEGYW